MEIVDLDGVYLAVRFRCDECQKTDMALCPEDTSLTKIPCRFCGSKNSDIIAKIYRIGKNTEET